MLIDLKRLEDKKKHCFARVFLGKIPSWEQTVQERKLGPSPLPESGIY